MKAIIKFEDWDVSFTPAQLEQLKSICVWPEGAVFDKHIHDCYDAKKKEQGLKSFREDCIVNLIKANGLPDFRVVKILDDSSQVDQLSAILDRLNGVSLQIAFNQKCNTGIGNEMLNIRQVKVETDCCTDHLQKELDDGWRILCVCPQPARRPDYILGK